eukprot:Hpha_TRINITY_DN27151_c0_g1::TRINITY_DN27151_c0_g1_i1::g.29360::m.29360
MKLTRILLRRWHMSRHFLDGREVWLDSIDHPTCQAGPIPPGACLAEAFSGRFDAYAGRPALGVPTQESEEAALEWVSYGALKQRAFQAAGQLRQCGVGPNDLVGVIGANSIGWFVAEYACLFSGAVSVPLSDSWTTVVLSSVASRCRLRVIVTDRKCLPLCLAAAEKTPSLKVLLVMGDSAPDRSGGVDEPQSPSSVRVMPLETDGVQPLSQVHKRQPTDLHTILHTSGTTGVPKGVQYPDSLWLRNMTEYPSELSVGFSYMPLAYITDRHTVSTGLWNGGRIGITRGQPAGREKGSVDHLFEDLQLIRPTVLKGVPKFWESVHEAANLTRDLGLKILGGRCHTLLCGAGALHEKTAAWFRTCHVGEDRDRKVQKLVAYGATECGNIAMNRIINRNVRWKLLPFEGLDCKTEGELAVSTDFMFSGYFEDEEKTAEAFTTGPDGWYYKTGDLVRVAQDGDEWLVDVVGRAKTGIKLSIGKWVFAEALEDLYRQVEGVRYVWIHGDNAHDQLVAVVDAEIPSVNPEDMLGKLRAHAALSSLPPHEWVGEVTIARQPFSRQDGTLNGTGKLDRTKLQTLYRDEVDTMYQRIEADASESIEGDKQISFASQGGTSIQAHRIAALYLKLGVDVEKSIGLLLREQSLGQAETKLRAEVRSIALQKTYSVEDDARLANDLPPPAEPCQGPCVLLTGATGFVGAHLVAELRNRGIPVVCIVRATDSHRAQKRMKQALFDRGLIDFHKRGREEMEGVEVLCGDLVSPMLGLDDETLDALRGRVGTLLHCGAVIDLAKGPLSYGRHRKANVLGTLEACKVAGRLGARLAFTSTTDVMPRGRKGEVELFDLKSDPPEARDGYSCSKWVSEQLVVAAQRGGLRCSILRLGMVGGNSRTGSCSAKDWLSRFFIGVSHSGSVPVTESHHTLPHSLPADAAARALVSLATSDAVNSRGVTVMSLAPLLTIEELARWLREFGGPFKGLETVPFERWIATMREVAMLSAWPILYWAEGGTEFPTFNTRQMVDEGKGKLERIVEELGDRDCLDVLRKGMDQRALKSTLKYLLVEEEISLQRSSSFVGASESIDTLQRQSTSLGGWFR